MSELKRITKDELVIAILSLWFNVSPNEIIRTVNDLHRNRKEPPGKEKELPELERIATECITHKQK